MSSVDESKKCSKITTSVEFLREVNAKGYSKTILRKYLIEKRGLSAEEVDVVFMINNNREEKTDGDIKRSKLMKELPLKKNATSERPERSFAGRKLVQDVGYLVPRKQVAGQNLINDFLDREKQYCIILECLQKEYYQSLARYADQGKFDMTRKEIDAIFIRIPELLKFHKGFFLDLKRGSNIGRMFVRLFKFFEGYSEYMKDCQKTVNKMRSHVRDARLIFCLTLLSKRSIRQNEDMIDLLLYPLERIVDYSKFLSKLYSWADRNQTSDYELLGKASRRIGRVATYIEKYKYGICNRNEMNKVQRFLNDQCDILAPDRSIIRRGMMIRRTSGWTARNKHYVFFLFSDMLLWTTKNGILQNALQLRSCEVMPSKAKTNAIRKFEVHKKGHKPKTLLLECGNVTERNDWYAAMKKTISLAKERCSLAWSKSEPLSNTNYQEFSENISDDEKDFDEDRVEQSEQVDDPYNNRYKVTSSFRMQEYKEIDPMDDNLSQISEQDEAFHKKHDNYPGMLPTSAQLSPFGYTNVKNNHIRRVGDNVAKVHSTENCSSDKPSSNNSIMSTAHRSSTGEQHHEVIEDSFEFFDKQRSKSNIIRRPERACDKPKSSEFTIRLDEF